MSKLSVFAVVCLAHILSSPALAQVDYDTDPTYQAARTAMIEGRDAEAFPGISQAAEAGFHKAQYNLALLYKDGRGTTASHANYLKWMEASAAQDFPLALFTLGVDYSFGRGTAKDNPRAFRYYTRAAELGHAGAQYYLAQMYREGLGTSVSPALYRKWMDASAAQNYSQALFRLGSDYDLGILVEKDLRRALGYYERAAAVGDSRAAYNVGQIYLMGEGGIPKDYGKAMAYIEQSAAKNEVNALMTLGYVYETGMTGVQDINRSRSYYYRAEAEGNPAASEAIDRLPKVASEAAFDKMLAGDNAGAVKAFGQLCDEGDMEACAYYGNYLANGAPGVTANLSAALPPLKKSCDAGEMYGCKFQAYAVVRTRRGSDDATNFKAATWFSNRCGYNMNKDAEACYNLAVMYYNGLVKGGKPAARIAASSACELNYSDGCRMVREIDRLQAQKEAKAAELQRQQEAYEAQQAGGYRSAYTGSYNSYSSGSSSSGSSSYSSSNTAQDNADFNAFINKVNSYGTGYSATCRTGNPYC